MAEHIGEILKEMDLISDVELNEALKVKGAVSLPEAIDRALEKYYGKKEDNLGDAMKDLGINPDDVAVVEEGKGQSIEDLEKLADATPVVKLLNLILLQAIKDRAADIH